jgi:nucleotide-binding universal stress UspA family protein
MATQENTARTEHQTVVFIAGDQGALEQAARHATARDRVIVVGTAQVQAAPVMTGGARRDPSELHRRRDDLDNAQTFLAERGIDADTVLVQGDAAAGIVSAAEEHDADLVIMAYERCGPLKRVLLGAVSDRVAQAAPCDVLVVR